MGAHVSRSEQDVPVLYLSESELLNTDVQQDYDCRRGKGIVKKVGFANQQFRKNFRGPATHIFRHICVPRPTHTARTRRMRRKVDGTSPPTPIRPPPPNTHTDPSQISHKLTHTHSVAHLRHTCSPARAHARTHAHTHSARLGPGGNPPPPHMHRIFLARYARARRHTHIGGGLGHGGGLSVGGGGRRARGQQVRSRWAEWAWRTRPGGPGLADPAAGPAAGSAPLQARAAQVAPAGPVAAGPVSAGPVAAYTPTGAGSAAACQAAEVAPTVVALSAEGRAAAGSAEAGPVTVTPLDGCPEETRPPGNVDGGTE